MDMSQPLPVGGVAQFEIDGQRSIMILDPALLSMSTPSKLSYYRGAVRSGIVDKRFDACNVIIFKFDGLEAAAKLYANLTKVDHPCVVKALGFANGAGEHIEHSFVALTPFDTTFATYIQKHGPGADQNGRLTEDFITLVSDIIDALEELHNLGYYCPWLNGDHIAVMRQSGLLSAKVWSFDACDPGMEEEQKDGDWFRLGCLIFSASPSNEVQELLGEIKSGKLKGKSIMKYSALLTVRKKFENILAFYLHISVNCQENSNQSPNKNELQVTEICAANLNNDLDRRLIWTTPGWTQGQPRDVPILTRTLRGFVNQIRIFIEHEILYIPEEVTRALTVKELLSGKKQKDLEHYLQDNRCGQIFRVVQRLVAELNLKY